MLSLVTRTLLQPLKGVEAMGKTSLRLDLALSQSIALSRGGFGSCFSTLVFRCFVAEAGFYFTFYALVSFRMVSSGRENVRFWRVRSGGLRLAPVSLGEHHGAMVSDVVFEAACPTAGSIGS